MTLSHVNNLAVPALVGTARVEYLMRIGFWPPLPPVGVGPNTGQYFVATTSGS